MTMGKYEFAIAPLGPVFSWSVQLASHRRGSVALHEEYCIELYASPACAIMCPSGCRLGRGLCGIVTIGDIRISRQLGNGLRLLTEKLNTNQARKAFRRANGFNGDSGVSLLSSSSDAIPRMDSGSTFASPTTSSTWL